MSDEQKDLLSDELDEVVDPADATETVPETKVEYTKTGRIKQNRPRTEAQIAAFAKAQARWNEMRKESVDLKKQALLKSREITLEKKKKDAEEEAKIKCERAVKKYEKQKSKIVKNEPMPVVPENTVVPEVAEVPEPDEPEPTVVKKVRKKKPVVIVQQEESESDLESDDARVIFVKRKAKPKEAVPDPRFVPKETNPFGRNYFFDRSAMS